MDHRMLASKINGVDKHLQKAFFVLLGKGSLRKKHIQFFTVFAGHEIIRYPITLFRFLKQIHRRTRKFDIAVL